jgi:phosphohistidine phosphatase
MSKRIHLIRHAKSSWAEAGLHDFDRPLNERGHRDAPAAAIRFARAWQPQALISSDALRAKTTATYFAETLKMKVIFDHSIYEAAYLDLLAVIYKLDESWNEVALFGHNPGMSNISAYLSGEYVDMPTCAVCTLELEVNEWKLASREVARLVSFDYPKKHL